MKILLVGEFSAFHKNLKEGLITLGHDVTLVSSGDGWKSIKCDIFIGSSYGGLLGKMQTFSRIITSLNKLTNYDVVQLISTAPFTSNTSLNYKIISFLKRNNSKLFLVGAGGSSTNTYIANYFEKHYKYHDYFNILKEGFGGEVWSQSKPGMKYNKWLHDIIDGYIPIMYEYAEPYRLGNYDKIKDTIPIPYNLTKAKYINNNSNGGKLNIFHGVIREREKGTPHIRKAMMEIQNKYPNDVDCIIDGKMPLVRYLKVLESSNIVIDQAYSISYGVNAVINLAMGKVVLSGCESECLREFNMDDSPIVPIQPNYKNIMSNLEFQIENRTRLADIGYKSRQYAELLHDNVNVAKKYLDVWTVNSTFRTTL